METLTGSLCRLRPVLAGDVERLLAIQAEPSVAGWWGLPRRQELADRVTPRADRASLAIEVDGEVAGLIEYTEENEPAFRHAAIDIFLATAFQGRGIGSDAIRTLARFLVGERGHHRLTMDPAVENTVAIRTYVGLGFRPVGVLREYWRGVDGTWRDGLLMDALARDLAL